MSSLYVSNEERDFSTVLSKRVVLFPDKPWIIAESTSHSYGEVEYGSAQLAQGFYEAGVKAGETVLIMLPDIIEYIFSWCALSKIGAIEVPVNVHHKGSILSYIINDSSAKVMIVHADYLDKIDLVSRDLKSLENIYVIGGQSKTLTSGIVVRDYNMLNENKNNWTGPGPNYYDLMAVMYTSGTTGNSKGGTISHAHAYEYALGVTQMLALEKSDVYYAPLPLFHIAGQFALVYAALIAGATAVLPGTFSARKFWQDVRAHGVTTTFLLGAMANFLNSQDHLEDDVDNPLERVLMVPLIPETEEFKSRFDCKVSTTWGGTEMNCPIRTGFDLVDNKSCGRVVDELYEVKIVDENDQELPAGMPGEAIVRAKQPWIMTNGYWNNPDGTVKVWRNLWYHTGDMLMRDEENNFYFVDRTKDAIRRRGENISSIELENEINAHPDVLECAVIPIESSATEQEIMAVIVPKPNRKVDPNELILFLEPRIAYFMVPRFIEVVNELPKTPTGKIQKFPLRQAGLSLGTWDRELGSLKLKC